MSKQTEFAVILKMNPMFADLGADELHRISSLCHTQQLGVGEVLFQNLKIDGAAIGNAEQLRQAGFDLSVPVRFEP